MTIVTDNSSILSEQSFELIDNARGIIYDRQMFIKQATGAVLRLTEFEPLISKSALKCSTNMLADI